MELTVSIGSALLIGVATAICLAGQLLGIYTNRVLVLSFAVGLILGDLPTALTIGALGELAFMGFGVGAGGTVPPNPMGVGIVGTIMAITLKSSGMTIGAALILSYPFAVLLQLALTATYTVLSGLPKAINTAIDEENYGKFKFLSNATFIAFLVIGFVIGLLSAIIISRLNPLIEVFPVWLLQGLTVAGRLLPVIGFAMIMNVLFKKEYLPYILLGYVCIAYLQLPVMGVAVVGGVFALIDYFRNDSAPVSVAEPEEEDFSNGI